MIGRPTLRKIERAARWPACARAGVGAVLAMGFAAAMTTARAEPDAAGPPALTVAILDLAEAPGLAPPKPARVESAPWRTSFGSERTTRREKKPTAEDGPMGLIASADAVLIQGVHAAAPLRRLFPPKTWRLVVSRAMAGADASFASNPRLPPTTAIAIKAREDLRVTARTRELRLTDAEGDPAAEGAASATAIRITAPGRAIWLASVVLPAGCRDEAACAARASLEAWRATKRGEGALTLVGGRTRSPEAEAPPDAPPNCAAHGIDSDLRAEPLALAAPSATPVAGCITIVRLEN